MGIKGTKEWAKKNYNIQVGCENNCRYCYAAANAQRFKMRDRDKWHEPVVNMMKVHARFRDGDTTMMFPSAHDITPRNADESAYVVDKMLRAGRKVLVVSKGGPGLIQFAHELTTYAARYDYMQKLVAGAGRQPMLNFRVSITSRSEANRYTWEPNAPTYAERLETLKYLWSSNMETSVSIEPMLEDVNTTFKMMLDVEPYVTESIWVGKMNMLKRRFYDGKLEPGFKGIMFSSIEENQTDDEILRLVDMVENSNLKETVIWKDSIRDVIERNKRFGKV